jgi:hypothetical protein
VHAVSWTKPIRQAVKTMLGGDLEDGGVTSRMGPFSPHHSEKDLFSPAKARASKNASFVRFFRGKSKEGWCRTNNCGGSGCLEFLTDKCARSAQRFDGKISSYDGEMVRQLGEMHVDSMKRREFDDDETRLR